MVTAATKPVTSAVYRILFYQIMLIAGFSLLMLIFDGMKGGFSAFIGGLVYWLPTGIFTRSVASCASARRAGLFMMTFLGGEVFKLVLSGTLFVLAALYLPVQIIDVVLGLIVGIAAFWAASIYCMYRSGVAA